MEITEEREERFINALKYMEVAQWLYTVVYGHLLPTPTYTDNGNNMESEKTGANLDMQQQKSSCVL